MSLALASRRAAISPAWVKNPLWRTARAVPSLDQPFADTKSLTDAVTGQSLVTFTRASSGTYVGSDGVLRTAAVNEPRFDHNPTTGESLGLLVEEQRTNNVLQSEDFATTWILNNISVSSNTVVAPDGTTTADTISPPTDGLTTPRFLRQNPALTTQQAYTLSLFVKAGTATTNGIALYVSDSTATNNFRGGFNIFNLATSAAGTGWATPTATIVPYPNGWYRCILSGVTSTAHTSLRASIYLSLFGNVADNFGSVHIWGAQLEAGAFATSYIPTTTAAATRSADVASITGTNFSSWYNQTEGTVYLDSDRNTAITTSSTAVSINDNSVNNRLFNFRHDNSTNLAIISVTGGILDAAAVLTLNTLSTRNKTSTAQALNNLAAVANGGSLVVDASVAMPVVNQMQIGNVTNTSVYNGTIRRLVYWGQRLPNNVLQAITQ